MTAPLSPRDTALLALFERGGRMRIETPILQPASLFLELSGEDIRRRLFLTQDADGREFCLRPEHTIPVCRQHLESGREAGEYCYLGPVFRQRGRASGEFLQAGIESIGREDAGAADSEVLCVALDGIALYPDRLFEVTTGDMDLIEALLAALEVPPNLQRRLVRQLSSGGRLEDALLPDNRPAATEYSGLLSAIEGQDPRAARAFVEDVISIAGIATVGGRSAGEIAERFLSRASQRSAQISETSRDVLLRYFAICGDMEPAADQIRRLAAESQLDIGPALDRFERRIGLMRAAGIDLSRLRFASRFARNLVDYTGFVFEIRDRAQPDGRFVVAGGRYDRLLHHLGSPKPLPAVGCSFWLDRLEVAA
jgi:ATP phosphoribosyltransferase regulatory subunit